MKDQRNMCRNLLLVVVESRLLQKTSLESLSTPTFLDRLMPLCSVQFGHEFCSAAVNSSVGEPQLSYVKKRCVQSVTELVGEVQERFPDDSETLLQLHLLQPRNAILLCQNKTFQNISARHLLIWIS